MPPQRLIEPLSAAASRRELRPSSTGIRPTCVEIDLGAVAHNARVLRQLAATPLYAVVKADGYGHGAAELALALDAGGQVDGYAVSLVEEGVLLREAGVTRPILVMGPAQRGGYDEMVARQLTPVASHVEDLVAVAAVGRRRGAPVDVHLKVDTGMGRLGVAASELAAVNVAGARVVGLMTHFACADTDDPADPTCMTYRQLEALAAAETAVRAAGAPIAVRHAANSSGAMMFPGARLDLVRVGLALYGNGRWIADAGLPAPRRQVMRFVSHVAQLRIVPAGGTVGYGALWRAARDTQVAVLPFGYADGLPRRATGRAAVLIRGQRCPLVGAISMDISIADVTAVAGITTGDEVVLLGEQGGAAITAAELGAAAGLTEYEVTCGISKRVPRIFRGGSGDAPG